MDRTYDIALPQHAAQAEWREFVGAEALVAMVGDVRFEAVADDRSRLRIPDREGSGVDAVVQRFREHLKNKQLAKEWRSP